MLWLYAIVLELKQQSNYFDQLISNLSEFFSCCLVLLLIFQPRDTPQTDVFSNRVQLSNLASAKTLMKV